MSTILYSINRSHQKYTNQLRLVFQSQEYNDGLTTYKRGLKQVYMWLIAMWKGTLASDYTTRLSFRVVFETILMNNLQSLIYLFRQINVLFNSQRNYEKIKLTILLYSQVTYTFQVSFRDAATRSYNYLVSSKEKVEAKEYSHSLNAAITLHLENFE